jgi:hypothetical protein
MSDLEEILISLYASEINASISWIWDGDIDVKLGDPLNGYQAEGRVGTFIHPPAPAAAQTSRSRKSRTAVSGPY